jgi:hypothetical protein
LRGQGETIWGLPCGFSIADPDDAGMLDIVGFATAADRRFRHPRGGLTLTADG